MLYCVHTMATRFQPQILTRYCLRIKHTPEIPFIYYRKDWGTMSTQTLTSMLSWIEMHLDQPITLSQMASHFGYSPYYCSARLHAYLQMPFRVYLTSRRLARAAEALRLTDQRILDIAVQNGFSSHEAFVHAFRRVYRHTPSSYRRQFSHLSGKKGPL